MGVCLYSLLAQNAKTIRLALTEMDKGHQLLWKPIRESYVDIIDGISRYLTNAIEKGLVQSHNVDLAAVMFFSFFYRSLVTYAFRGVERYYTMDRESITGYVDLFVHGLLPEVGDEKEA
jgi:hypothetical protein